MTHVKTEKLRKLLNECYYGYNPNKRIQYCRTFTNKKAYIENIKEQWSTFLYYVLEIVLLPFLLLGSLYLLIQSLFPYSLVITKKELLKNKIDNIEEENK